MIDHKSATRSQRLLLNANFDQLTIILQPLITHDTKLTSYDKKMASASHPN